ncbi:MAG: hypothetical protein IJ419_13645 [Agathobacter sp.]|nr:hypothetical protein [Agathobacter sp.]
MIKISIHLIQKKTTIGDKTYLFASKGGRIMLISLIAGFLFRYLGYINWTTWGIIGMSAGLCLIWDIITSVMFSIKMTKLRKEYYVNNPD